MIVVFAIYFTVIVMYLSFSIVYNENKNDYLLSSDGAQPKRAV